MIDNLFLYIIWNKAYIRKKDILNDIQKRFEVVKVIEGHWSPEHFTNNLNRFYGEKLPKNSFKEKACGNGPFTLVVCRDAAPLYEERKTTRGEMEKVNIHTFDAKTLYRSWTNDEKGHNCVHGTNSPEETRHDLTLLTGLSPEDFSDRHSEISQIGDLAGCNGWRSEGELFYILNNTCKYMVVEEDSSVIKIMTDNYFNTLQIAGDKVLDSKGGRRIEIHWPGDCYLETEWAAGALENRVLCAGKYVMSEDDGKEFPHKRKVSALTKIVYYVRHVFHRGK